MSAMLLFQNDKNGARPTQSSGEFILVLCKRFLNSGAPNEDIVQNHLT